METVCHPIINTPKPVAPPPPAQPVEPTEANHNNAGDNEKCPVDEHATKKGKPVKTNKTPNKSENMDVD